MSISRRELVEGGAVFAVTLAAGGVITALDGEGTILRPPGAQDEEHFKATCLKCNRCVSICPENCLRTATINEGLLNYRTPYMDFHKGVCTFCGECELACPTTSIQGVSEDTSVIGIAVVDEERCIAFQQRGCTVCKDACTYEAITIGDNGHPIVDTDLCNGCGRCEYACPSNTYLAYVGGTRRGINVEKEA